MARFLHPWLRRRFSLARGEPLGRALPGAPGPPPAAPRRGQGARAAGEESALAAGHLVRPRVSHGRQTRSSRARSRSRSRSPHPKTQACEDPAAARSRRRRGRSSRRRGRGRRRSHHRRPGGGSGNWRGGRRAVHHGCPSWPRFIREDQGQYEPPVSIMPVHAARHAAAVPDDGPRRQRFCRGRPEDCAALLHEVRRGIHPGAGGALQAGAVPPRRRVRAGT
mmetsp:Transcript_110487/g.237772  ORF Transcript_110487/g.237772 Transcript_110487/m.237772 type:complete len:222 (+) Transcript_110487:987-1652(+)